MSAEDRLVAAATAYADQVRVARLMAARVVGLPRVRDVPRNPYAVLPGTIDEYEDGDCPIGSEGIDLDPAVAGILARIEKDCDWLAGRIQAKHNELMGDPDAPAQQVSGLLDRLQMGKRAVRPKGAWSVTAMQKHVVRIARSAGWACREEERG